MPIFSDSDDSDKANEERTPTTSKIKRKNETEGSSSPGSGHESGPSSKKRQKREGKTLQSNIFLDSGSDDDGSDWEKKTTSKHKKKKHKKAAKSTSSKRSKIVSDDEEGEIDSDESDTPQIETQKSSRRTNNSDLYEGTAFLDGYDSDLVGDDDDKEALEAMNEKQREEELFRRLERREMLKTRHEIEKRLNRDQKNKSTKQLEKSAKTTTEKQKETKARAMQDLLAKRKEKLKEAEKEKKDSKKTPLKLEDVFGEDEEDDKTSSSSKSSSSSSSPRRRRRSQSDSSSDEEDAKSKELKKVELSSIHQVERIRLSRFRLAKLVHTPGFHSVVQGCFVRIGIGQNMGRSVYRVSQIVGVVETGKIYNVEGTRTNKGLKLKHGTQERVFRLEYVSNNKFSESEFQKWLQTMKYQGQSLPTMELVERKQKELKESLQKQLTEDDVQQMVQEKKRFERHPRNYAVAKTTLMKQRDAAQERGDDTEVVRINYEMESLESRASDLDKKRSASLTAVGWINQRNRDKMKEVFLSSENAKLIAGPSDIDNPYSRKKTLTKMNAGKAKELREAERGVHIQLNQIDPQDEGPPVLPGYVPLPPLPAPIPGLGRKTSEDLFSAHDFDINIEMNINLPAPIMAPPAPIAALPPAPVQNKRSLDLNAYKKRRGLL